MRDRVTTSEYAYYWGLDIGDREIMRIRVTNPYWSEKVAEWPRWER